MEDDVLPVTTTLIGTGIVDDSRQFAPRTERINFRALATAEHTVSVTWDAVAPNTDVRFIVRDANNVNISGTVRDSNPLVWSGELIGDELYSIGVFAADGAANFDAIIEASVPLNIIEQPSDRIVTAGEIAFFAVEASGSGILSYQWFADGETLQGETGSSLTVFGATTNDNGTQYSVAVSNANDTLVSEAATLTVVRALQVAAFSQNADTAPWVLEGPAPTLNFNAGAEADTDTDAWGRELLRIDNTILVGGDFTGIKATRFGNNNTFIDRPFLAALDAVTGQPVGNNGFQTPSAVDAVVRAMALSPDGRQVYVGGDFGLLALDSTTGNVEIDFSNNQIRGGGGTDTPEGRVFDIAVTSQHIYIGGDFQTVDGNGRRNIARLDLDFNVDNSWNPAVANGFSSGRSAPVQSVAVSPTEDMVYLGGTFQRVNDTDVSRTELGGRISLMVVSALDGTVQPERYRVSAAALSNNIKGLTGHDIAVSDNYVFIAWGGPNYVTFHALDGTLLRQYLSLIHI